MNAPLDRFQRDLRRLNDGGRLGLAVSGGSDSLALLLLAAAARPGAVEAATVDHGLRRESAAEAAAVAALCRERGLPHATLPVTLAPGGNLQARAREVRYAALAAWAEARGLIAVLTAHHADDQAETLLMRLARGAGPSGLCGIRERTLIEGANGRTLQLLRPLLGWRKQELVRLVAEAGIAAADDPSNRDRRHRRAHARQLLAEAPWIDPVAVAASASHLADAEEALSYAAEELAEVRVMADDRRVTIDAADLPRELQRRLLLLAFDRLRAPSPRGPDLDRALACLAAGRTCTLSGLRLSGGEAWTIAPAPPRRAASGQ